MPVVEKTSGGRVHIRDVGETFHIGDQADVSEAQAAYLCEERGDFERVGDEPGPGAEGDADEDSVELVAEPPINPADHTIAELEEALADGEYSDAELDAIADAEAASDDRTGAHDAINAAREG
jgi:hypothetical protein